MQDKTTQYLRVKAVADRYDVSVATIYRAIQAGELQALRIQGAVRIPADALAAYEARVSLSDKPAVSETEVFAGHFAVESSRVSPTGGAA